jgi:hypothetical protein
MQGRFTCLELFLKLLGTASFGCLKLAPIRLDEETSLSHLPIYAVLFQKSFEPLKSQPDRLVGGYDNPDSHEGASSTADAAPKYEQRNEASPPNASAQRPRQPQ